MKCLSKTPVHLDFDMSVATPLEDRLIMDQVIKECPITIEGRELDTDLILLGMQDFDVILGMDWLVSYHAVLDCFGKRVIFQILEQSEFFFYGDRAPLCVLVAF